MKRLILIIIPCFTCLVSFPPMISRIESLQSLYIEVYRDQRRLGTATGFIIKSKTQSYLVTNWHVVTGKNPITRQWLDSNNKISPNRIIIVHNAPKLGEYVIREEKLLDKNDKPLWFENMIKNEMVDVVEIPLKDTSKISIFPVRYSINNLDTTVLLQPTTRVFILGFPLSIHSAPFMPIWKSGTMASEPDIDQENKPIVWVDVATFPGMSGSPVYFVENQFTNKEGGQSMVSGGFSIFLGVFSHANNVIGALCKAQYLRKIFDALP